VLYLADDRVCLHSIALASQAECLPGSALNLLVGFQKARSFSSAFAKTLVQTSEGTRWTRMHPCRRTPAITPVWNLLRVFFLENVKIGSKPFHGLPIKRLRQRLSQLWPIAANDERKNVTAKTSFERLYLVLELHKIAPWVKCPYAPHNPDRSHYNYFSIFVQFFPPYGPSLI